MTFKMQIVVPQADSRPDVRLQESSVQIFTNLDSLLNITLRREMILWWNYAYINDPSKGKVMTAYSTVLKLGS